MRLEPLDSAAEVTGVLWAALQLADRNPQMHHHYPGAFDPAWCARLPLHTDEPEHPVQLADTSGFENPEDARALREAYAHQPRTRIYAGLHGYDPWIDRAAVNLTRLSASEHPVRVAAYASAAADATLGVHTDRWRGAVLQLRGSKQWRLGPGLLCAEGGVHTVVLTPGDVLIVPKRLPHEVCTPPDPGHSMHLVFTIDRDVPRAAG